MKLHDRQKFVSPGEKFPDTDYRENLSMLEYASASPSMNIPTILNPRTDYKIFATMSRSAGERRLIYRRVVIIKDPLILPISYFIETCELLITPGDSLGKGLVMKNTRGTFRACTSKISYILPRTDYSE